MQRAFLGMIVIGVSSLVLTSCGGRSNEAVAVADVAAESDVLKVVSNRADLVSGGDVLIELLSGNGNFSATLNGEDVSAAFEPAAEGRYRALLTGLRLGSNSLTASSDVGSATVEVINHPNSGPVFAGPQLQPWTCNNADAVDENCNQPPAYEFLYKSSNPALAGLQPYDPENPPADVAETTTDEGVTVPYIVRLETGYQDRDQYRIAVLYQPDQPWTPGAPQQQFNHKMLVLHGASCGTDYESAEAADVLPGAGGLSAAGEAIARGYATMSTALNNSGHNCNVALQAESVMMAKERVIEQYGDLRYTLAAGCSGGSLALQWMANAYPGLYQGLLPTCSFTDAWSTATQFLDYHLTINYFTNPTNWGIGVVWEENQMAAVQDHITVVNSQVSDTAQFSVAVPTSACAGVSDEQRYHPQTNPGGVRCTIHDAAINLFAPRPEEIWSENEQQIGRGFAGFPVDNIGVQYGLNALRQGLITPAQFVDINLKIGGLDEDTNIVPERLQAVEPALANGYRTGLINQANNLDQVAIIDCRGPDPGAFHDAYRAYSMRARLDREHGNHDNHLIWEGPVALLADADCGRQSFLAMDRWIAAVEMDESADPLPQKVIANKPADLSDACFSGAGQQLLDSTCGQAVVGVFGTPRTGAGDAITTDNNKCQLKALNREDDYGPIGLSDEQWASLQTVFPDGVCDFSKPGVSQQGTVPWLSYQDANGEVIYGGEALSPAPKNSGIGWASPAFAVFAN